MLAATLGATTALAVLSPALTLMRSVPQVVRVLRAGTEGVSATTWMSLFVLAELWATYGVLARIPAELATNVPSAGLCLAVVLLTASRRGRLRSAALGAAALSLAVAVFVACCVLAHCEGVESGAAVAGSLGIYLPQLARALGARCLTGVSPLSWAVAFLAAISWGAYGLLIHKVPVFLPNFVMAPAALAIALRTWARRPRPLPPAVEYR